MAEEAEGCLLNRLNPDYLGTRVVVRHHIEGRELSESLCVKCCEPSFLLLSSPRTYSLQKEVWGTFLCRNQRTPKRMLNSVPTSMACPGSPPSSPSLTVLPVGPLGPHTTQPAVPTHLTKATNLKGSIDISKW